MSSWIKPKSAHKQMVQRLLQTHAHLIICLRAEEKVAMVKDENKKTQVVPLGFQPICDKSFPFELTLSALFTDKAPGVPQFIKLQEQHRHAFKPGEQISRATGEALAKWAAGGAPRQAPAAKPAPATIDYEAVIKAFLEFGGREYVESYIGRPAEQITATDREDLLAELKRLKTGVA